MKILRHFLSSILAVFFVVVCAATCLGLTIEVDVTAAYVKEHAKEFSVEVSKATSGLLDFKIVHNLPEPKYHVAHLSVYHQGKLIAQSDTPAFGKKNGNTFHFSLAPEILADSQFTLSDSAVGGSGENSVPLPGTVIYKFRLNEFVPEQLLKPGK